MKRAASRFADVELSTTPTETAVPAFVAAMALEWQRAFQAYRGRHTMTSIGSITGLLETRAARLLEGVALATREEAAAIDSALGTDSRRLYPIGSASIVQRAAAPIVARGRHAANKARRARMKAWEARLLAFGQPLGALALATGIVEGRVRQIVRSGAFPTVAEQTALVAVLGEEP